MIRTSDLSWTSEVWISYYLPGRILVARSCFNQ